MDFKVSVISPEAWDALATDAHLIGFGEKRDPNHCYTNVVVAFSETEMLGYIGVVEHSKTHGHMQHGAAMPSIKGKGHTSEVYTAMMTFLKEHYKVLTALVINENLAMIHLHHKQDLRIIGCNCYSDGVYLHMRWECAK